MRLFTQLFRSESLFNHVNRVELMRCIRNDDEYAESLIALLRYVDNNFREGAEQGAIAEFLEIYAEAGLERWCVRECDHLNCLLVETSSSGRYVLFAEVVEGSMLETVFERFVVDRLP